MSARPERAGRPRPPSHHGNGSTFARRSGFLAALLFALLLIGTSATNAQEQVKAGSPGPAQGPLQLHGTAPDSAAAPVKATGPGKATSPNWAGYAVTGASFSDVTGSWGQPTATCPVNQQQYAAFWVGIDGLTSSTVEQIGTDSDCNKGNKKNPGGPHYYAWWEMFPQPQHKLSTTSYPVSPNDNMTADVSGSGSSFTLTLTDNSQSPPWTFSITQTGTAAATAASAEWIAESPASKLANFGMVTFSGIGVSAVPSTFTYEQLTMQKGKLVKASAQKLSPTSFSVTWHHN